MRSGLAFQRRSWVPRIKEIASLLWPTLSASRYGSNRGGAAGRVGPIRHSLDDLLKKGLLPTLTFRDGRTLKGNVPPPNHMGGLSLSQTLSGELNPEWTEWFMGFPRGWTDAGEECSETLSSPRSPSGSGAE
jgi:hypothetical protein